MRFALMAFTMVALAGCGGSTEPQEPPAYEGTWRAVRVAGSPLPYRDTSTFPYIQIDSLKLTLSAERPDFGVLEDYTRVILSETESLGIGCGVFISFSSTSTTVSNGPVLCDGPYFVPPYSRRGDSLAVTWRGVDIRLVKLP